jgi:alkylhydroperoxidase family enzyme
MPLPSKLQIAVDALLNQPGATELELRRAVLERTRSGASQVPEALREFVEKIAERPWTVSDEDFVRLRAAGYSEDELYEVTLAAAIGAGLQRFDAGLRAMEEGR